MSRLDWPDPADLRIGLGCMRLSTDADRDEQRALETIAVAAAAGVTVFDTARSYGLGPHEAGHNEQLLARALRQCGAADRARIVTKGGMSRTGGGWIPDGRAKAIQADCAASLEALDGLQIDLFLIHAPDPRTPWRTSVRALARLAEDGLVRQVGLSNVNRRQLDEALEHAPVAAVQVALSPFDDKAVRGGVVERCEELGIAFIAHSPLGGPKRAGRLASHPAIAPVAEGTGATPAEVALAWLLSLSRVIVPIPGARRPETARSAARAGTLRLDERACEALTETLHGPRRPRRRRAAGQGEVVVVMGIPGAGKSRIATDYAARAYHRLNRDERGGSLRELADALDVALAAGVRRLVLDNTYLTRASRSYVVEAAARHGVPARCVWLDTPLAQAQVNLVERLLDLFGELPTPEQVREAARRNPAVLAPTSQMRALRELEPPTDDEGFADVERVAFTREAGGGRAGVLVAAAALREARWKSVVAELEPDAPHLMFDWSPDAAAALLEPLVAELSSVVAGPAESAVCPHGGGPPVCWCRPPLPGLALAFARRHGVEAARSAVVGTSAAHRTLATTLGAQYVAVAG